MEAFTFYQTRHHSPLYVKKLKPGCPLTIQITGDNNLRFTSHLIGYEVGAYLLVALPVDVRQHFQSNMLAFGQQAIVRMLLEGEEGKCIAFESSIESCMTHPHDFVFLTFPKKVESCELRKYPRLSTCMSACVCNAKNNDNVLTGRMKDVSLGGCRFVFDMPEKAKAVNYKAVNFYLGDDKSSDLIHFAGEIRSQRMHHGQMQVGIKFDSDESVNEKALLRLHIDRDSLLGVF